VLRACERRGAVVVVDLRGTSPVELQEAAGRHKGLKFVIGRGSLDVDTLKQVLVDVPNAYAEVAGGEKEHRLVTWGVAVKLVFPPDAARSAEENRGAAKKMMMFGNELEAVLKNTETLFRVQERVSEAEKRAPKPSKIKG